ncbi:MAG TPA: hypothetical protein VFK30_12010, partial [Anaerolineae bacterium]|nr:hypothetical protein [Anaerolineae bacterium]
GVNQAAIQPAAAIIKLLTVHQAWFKDGATAGDLIEKLFSDVEVEQFLKVNRYQDILWFNKESFEQLLWWLFAIAVVQAENDRQIRAAFGIINRLLKAEAKTEYQVEKLQELFAPKKIEIESIESQKAITVDRAKLKTRPTTKVKKSRSAAKTISKKAAPAKARKTTTSATITKRRSK